MLLMEELWRSRRESQKMVGSSTIIVSHVSCEEPRGRNNWMMNTWNKRKLTPRAWGLGNHSLELPARKLGP